MDKELRITSDLLALGGSLAGTMQDPLGTFYQETSEPEVLERWSAYLDLRDDIPSYFTDRIILVEGDSETECRPFTYDELKDTFDEPDTQYQRASEFFSREAIQQSALEKVSDLAMDYTIYLTDETGDNV